MFRAAFALVIVTAAGAQTMTPDTQALQALVTEIRQLRQDLQATNIITQRVQIVLYRLQTQTALVTGAASRLDDALVSLGKFQSDKRIVAAQANQLEEDLRSEQNPVKRKEMEIMVTSAKATVERMGVDEQRLQSREIDAATQLRTEQSKLAGLQDQLDRLDKLLDNLTRKQP